MACNLECGSRRALLPNGRSALSIAAALILVGALAILLFPAAYGQDSGTSTYIVVFNGTPGVNALASEGVSTAIEAWGGQVVHRYESIDGMAVNISEDEAGLLSTLPDVKYVEKDQPIHVLLDQSVPIIGADQVWVDGYTGLGVKVAVLDTGIDSSHPDLNGTKVIAWKDFTGGNYITPHDGHGHGTHVSGIIAGSGNASDGLYRGVAPDANLIEGKVLNDAGSGYTSWAILGIDWAVANGAQVISISFGGPHTQSMDDAIANATARGVVVVVAAGNSGPTGSTIECPGDAPDAITVGAVDKSDVIASFSSRGPTSDGRVKPDVVNIGVAVVSTRSYNGWNGANPATNPYYPYYMSMDGTSMATPMTSGVVALMLQKNDSLTPAEVKGILRTTAKPSGTVPNNITGWGRVQAKYAVDNVTASPACTCGPRTVWSDRHRDGTVSGRVTSSLNATAGIAGAYVYLVDASNASNVYNATIADAGGNYSFECVNATYSSTLLLGPNGQTGSDYALGTGMYAVYARLDPYGEGNSSAFGVDANASGTTPVSVVVTPPPNLTQFGPQTVWSDMGLGGSATGRVTVSLNGSTGVGGARVALVNASNASEEYCIVYADEYGNYTIPAVNATYSSGLGQGPNGRNGSDYANGTGAYRVHANNGTYGDGSSAAFGVDANESGPVLTCVVIFTRPARIDLVAEKPYVAANGSDNITITAYVYDAFGYPVADGFSVNFTIGNATCSGFTAGGFPWGPGNGSLGSAGNNSSLDNPTQNGLGAAAVRFGWVDAEYGGNNTTVWAYYTDNTSVNASIKIYLGPQLYNYKLVQDWNLISVPLNVMNNSIDSFFPEAVKNEIVDLWGWNASSQKWTYYSPDPNTPFKGYELIMTMDAGKAYWANMNHSTSFIIQGLIPDGTPNATIPLVSNWNFVGVTGIDPIASDIMYPTSVDVWSWNATAQKWTYYSPDPNTPFTGYELLDIAWPGIGQWVNI